jgi:hypothetical protein
LDVDLSAEPEHVVGLSSVTDSPDTVDWSSRV